MAQIDQIKQAILKLSPEEFRRLSRWFQELQQVGWDKQLASAISESQADSLAGARKGLAGGKGIKLEDLTSE